MRNQLTKNAFGTSFKFGARKGILIKIEELNILFEAPQKIDYTWEGARCFSTEWNKLCDHRSTSAAFRGSQNHVCVSEFIRELCYKSLGRLLKYTNK